MSDSHSFWLLYDKQCPFCRNYVRLLRIREDIGNLQVFDARTHPDLIKEAESQNLNIDEGLILKQGDQYYSGDQAMHILALMSTRSGVFNRINYWIFGSKPLATLLYPACRFGRNLTLKLLGIKKIYEKKDAQQ